MQLFLTRLILLKALILIITYFPNTLHSENRIVISSFSTSVADQDDAVKKNISIACDRINGAMLKSGDVFSFNETVGEGSVKNGFVDGRVLYRDHIRYEPGGGLCQVSSTLFNVMLMAGCRIVERHRHFQPVTYVPLGLDATIKYGKKDLRMRNTLSQNFYISASMNDKSLIIIIYGEKKLNYRYLIDTDEDEIAIPFAKEKERIRQGISVYVYRKKFKDNELIENFLLYKDFYPPVYLK